MVNVTTSSAEDSAESQDLSGWQVILRQEDDRRVVLYHPENQRLLVNRDAGWNRVLPSSRIEGVTGVNVRSPCPLCGQSKGEDVEETRWTMPSQTYCEDKPFMASNYFRLLAQSSNTSSNAAPDVSDEAGLHRSALNEGYYSKFFVEERRLGSGSRGSVFLCQHVVDDVHLGRYAVKKIPVGNNHMWLVNMLREVRILEELHHPNIISYKHTWLENSKTSDFGVSVPCLFVLTEFANSGNLAQYMTDDEDDDGALDAATLRQRSKPSFEKRRRLLKKLKSIRADASGSQADTNSARKLRLLPENIVWKFFMDVLSGLDHLHRHNIVHRDLKPQNLLLHLEENATVPRVLLSDFGECEFLTKLDGRHRTGATGTIEFVAPELLEIDTDGSYFRQYDKRCDIWSLGVVLYQLSYSQLPWDAVPGDSAALTSEILKYSKLSREQFARARRSTELQLLIQNILVRNPDMRPTTSSLLDIVSSFLSSTEGVPPPSPLVSAQAMRDSSQMVHMTDSSSELEHLPLLLDSASTVECLPAEPVYVPTNGHPKAPGPTAGEEPFETSSQVSSEAVLGPQVAQRGDWTYYVDIILQLALAVAKLRFCLDLSRGAQITDSVILPIASADMLALTFRWPWIVHIIVLIFEALWLFWTARNLYAASAASNPLTADPPGSPLHVLSHVTARNVALVLLLSVAVDIVSAHFNKHRRKRKRDSAN
mmetsp:Transcript_2471/g.7375  ORF Transcript_2471/g.7375 Transcript_2471/m.7375 type:complete len:709 (-) Transcript_2471:263-2389(-)|eukprot:CAMPEP_0198728824 /NCGR_PEP_ID=MMETSP1475-20131203/11855_1 /TAXON_ID= ORGANISM="Unidentified sp., Strain CCMP1999" /NCGR_SAMPLE_ID=MMETSP1475 /ASSEMBLY_ACC=CAM_ASM_001111 /LENGTH=708 /DNA_ID=CAMNT_0044491295 /DNA_START=139 /DNA_END=2265 /DNA_ORIENTATION=+